MTGNTFGNKLQLTTFGESHGPAIGGVIDGCPAGLEVDLNEVQKELDRRKPGQSKITTQRKESDTVEFLSGIFEGKTTGTPIGFIIRNEDQRSKDYNHIKDVFRPSHADYTYHVKYGHRDFRGGGRSSARETACRVVAGAVAKQYLGQIGVSLKAYVSRVGVIEMNGSLENIDFSKVDENIVRCPDENIAREMIKYIESIRKEGDTVGGTVSCLIKNTPAGLGEPVFRKLHADLAAAMMGINAVKGFEFGSGFAGTFLKGSFHSDEFYLEEDEVRTMSNRSGGIQGGISNGEDIHFAVAFKPVATIMRDQRSVDKDGKEVTVKGKGRHDPCVLPRAVPIVEAMAALVIMDHHLMAKTNKM